MSKENQNKKYDGQNRCRRCDRPLKDPTDAYGWRCAEILGLGNHQAMTSPLDDVEEMVYNAYMERYLDGDKNNRSENFTVKRRKYTNTFVREKTGESEDVKYTVISDVTVLGENFKVEYMIDNGVVRFNFENNENYWSIMWRGGGKRLARAIYDAGKSISSDNLSWRTVDGINAELQLHWAAYKIGIKKENAKIADIGGIKRNRNDFDSNAWLFETIQLTEDIIDPKADDVVEFVVDIWRYLQ